MEGRLRRAGRSPVSQGHGLTERPARPTVDKVLTNVRLTGGLLLLGLISLSHEGMM
jgi:hypothetical protein